MMIVFAAVLFLMFSVLSSYLNTHTIQAEEIFYLNASQLTFASVGEIDAVVPLSSVVVSCLSWTLEHKQAVFISFI